MNTRTHNCSGRWITTYIFVNLSFSFFIFTLGFNSKFVKVSKNHGKLNMNFSHCCGAQSISVRARNHKVWVSQLMTSADVELGYRVTQASTWSPSNDFKIMLTRRRRKVGKSVSY